MGQGRSREGKPADRGVRQAPAQEEPEALLQYVAKALKCREVDQAPIPCELSGDLHDNSSGTLRGFASAAAKRQWFDERIAALKAVGGDILGNWHALDPDFVMQHIGLSGVPMPPYRQLQEQVHSRMMQQTLQYQTLWDNIPKEEKQPLQDFGALWPPMLPRELKQRCVQPEEAYTMRLNYAAGVLRLELLYAFTAGLAAAVELRPEKAVRWSVKRPMRLWNKAMVQYAGGHAVNDFRLSVDVYRSCIVAETCRQIRSMLRILECLGRETFDRDAPLRAVGLGGTREHFVVERIRNRFERRAVGGYADVLVNLRINGYVVELQIHLKKFYDLLGETGPQVFKWFKHFVRDNSDYGADECTMQHQIAGGSYNGPFQDGRRHGHGPFFYHSGDRYVGQWENGAKHGVGTYTHIGGDRYVGEWRDDRMHGDGEYTSASGKKYTGEFRDGMRHGPGQHTDSNGTSSPELWYWNKRCEMVNA